MKKICLFLGLILTLSTVFMFGCGKNQNKTTYKINVTLKENILSGSETVTFYNHSENTFKELKFNLFANAFREGAEYVPISSHHSSKAYYDGINYGDMTIDNVYTDKEKTEFTIGGKDKNILIVPLKSEVFPEEKTTVTIDFKVKLAKVIARTGINSSTINLCNFYPILCGISHNSFYECLYYANGDPFFSDMGNYDVTLTCDKKYVVATSGKLIDIEENEHQKTYHYQSDDIRSFAIVMSEKFQVKEKKFKDIDIKYYYYNDKNPDESISVIEKSINLFSEKFGDFIYDHYSVVETEFVQGGMEYSGLTMISDDLDGLPYLEVIVHETAHQWWQTAVGNNEIEYGFLDEGLAEYSVVVFYENFSDYGYTRENLIKAQEDTFKLFCSVSDKIYHKKDTSMLRSLDKYRTEYEYVNIAYIKPVIMYEYLRKSIGDEKFFSGLKKYYKTYKKSIAEPQDLVGAFEKCGTDTNGYFETFFMGKEII